MREILQYGTDPQLRQQTSKNSADVLADGSKRKCIAIMYCSAKRVLMHQLQQSDTVNY